MNILCEDIQWTYSLSGCVTFLSRFTACPGPDKQNQAKPRICTTWGPRQWIHWLPYCLAVRQWGTAMICVSIVLRRFLRIQAVQKVIHNPTQLSGRGFPHIFYMRSILSQFYVFLMLQNGCRAGKACFYMFIWAAFVFTDQFPAIWGVVVVL